MDEEALADDAEEYLKGQAQAAVQSLINRRVVCAASFGVRVGVGVLELPFCSSGVACVLLVCTSMVSSLSCVLVCLCGLHMVPFFVLLIIEISTPSVRPDSPS